MPSDEAPGLSRNGFARGFRGRRNRLVLPDRSRVAVIGGGPAGSLFGYFVCRLARSAGLDACVDIYEPRSFANAGPSGCNHCGGIVSESLVQLLAVEGIQLPAAVVRRGIESYVLHTDVGDVHIATPMREKRIASVFRGNGPRGSSASGVGGFDRFLLDLASSQGCVVVRKLVNGLRPVPDGFEVCTPEGPAGRYDLVAVATGINSHLAGILCNVAPRYEPPRAQRTFICEFDLGEAQVRRCLGDSMHVFLLDIPRVEFAALIPKGRFVTLCLLGDDVDDVMVARFLAAPEVSRCFPESTVPRPACHCYPRINAGSARRPFADRIVWIGDSGVTRLYKDGIGSAYRTAKAAANTAVLHGIAEDDFESRFWPECRGLIVDNAIASVMFCLTRLIQRRRFLRRAVLRMTAVEQASVDADKPMSSVLWDIFTGSAPYREILMRALRPGFPATLAWNVVAANVAGRRPSLHAGDPRGGRSTE